MIKSKLFLITLIATATLPSLPQITFGQSEIARNNALDVPLPAAEVTKCRLELQAEIANHKGLGRWTEQAPASTGSRTFRSPSRVFGRWIELSVSSKGTPTLFEVTAESTIEMNFNDRCTTTSKLKAGLDFSRTYTDPTAEWFDDTKLKALMGSSKSGVIYVWSPGMVYSAKFLKSFRSVAKAMKVDFTPLVDPRSKTIEMLAMSKEYGFAPIRVKLNAVELYMRNPTIHYPSTMVYKDGKIHSSPIVGVMPPKEIEAEVSRRIQDLENSRIE